MSENGVNDSSHPEQSKEIMMPGVRNMNQFSLNGRASSQDSSRGSSPSPYMASIPASQLPPSRSIPASQLPPSSSINTVTQKVSQLSVQNQLLSNVNRPNSTSTPNETADLPKKLTLDSGDFSPITSKTDRKTNIVQQNFQEIPLHPDKNVSNTNHFADLNSEMIDSANKLNQCQESSVNSSVSDVKGSGIPPVSFNSQLFQTNQIRNFNVITSLNQQVSSQPSQIGIDTKPIGSQHFQEQNPRMSPFQSLAPQNLPSQQFKNISTAYDSISQQNFSKSGQISHNVQAVPLSRSSPAGNVPPHVPNLNVNNPSFQPTPMNQMTAFPSVQVNRTSTNFGQPPVQNQRPTQPNFPSPKPPMLPVGNNQNFQKASPTTSRPNFNLNPMGTQGHATPLMSQPGNVGIPVQNNLPPLPGGSNPLVRPGFPSNANIQQQRVPSINQDFSPTRANTAMLHGNRYPTIPAQRVSSQPNLQSTYNQQFQPQFVHNQQYNTKPASGYNTPNFNHYQNVSPNQSVVNQGFNKLWGAENYDLLQTANILPPTRIEPPQITLGNDTLNAANCSGEIFRSTVTKIPESQSLLQKSRLPLGILIHPFKDLTHLSVIQCNVIVRCRACRTYINPFVYFVDSKRWKCNLCYRVNDLPEEFQYDPVSKTYGDPSRRPEIKSSTIEYIAPAEYMLRPPQPAVYLFLLDVSRLAVESGYLHLFSKVLLEELVNLPGDSRMQVGFIAFDSCLHFFSLAEGLSQPHEMMVLDIDDVFLPCPDNLLVNLKDRMELVKDLLNQLPSRYNNSYDNNSALGAALQAAHRMMSATGGRVTVFQASLPNVGPGALTAREDPNQRASAEVNNLKPANDFYKRLALDCSSHQIAVDLFIVNSQYVDIATISGISRFSGGCIYHFPLFKFERPILSEKLTNSLRRYITRKIGFEAVMRIRCTRGMSIHTFHGNFFVRSTDLLSLPNVNPDSGYGMQVSIDENLSDVENVCFQAALLYTSSKGERRIRVHTLCLPVVSTLHDVINSADQQCIIGLLAKMAVDRSIESSLSDAREAFINVAIDILSSYKLSLNLGSTPGGLLAPNCLKLLPLYISALLKNQAFRTGTSTRLDDRVQAMFEMKTKPLPWLIQSIYPDLYPVHNLEEQQVILNMMEEPVHVPPHLQLTSRLIDNNGAYLMDTGDHMMLYICSGVSQVFLKECLGVTNFNMLSDQMYEIPTIENQANQRLISLIDYLNSEKPHRATIQIIKDNSPSRSVFLERLIEDRVENALSYHEFLQHIKAQVK